MFTSIRKYHVSGGSIDELVREVESGLVPLLSKAPGYLGHYVIASDDGSVVSITGTQDRASVKNLNRLAETWAKDHLKKFKISSAEVSEGEVRVMHRAE